MINEREGQGGQLRKSNLLNRIAGNQSIKESFMKRLNDEQLIRNKAKYNFGDYHSYDTIISWLNDIEYYYPTIAKVFNIGQTYERRDIKGIKVSVKFL